MIASCPFSRGSSASGFVTSPAVADRPVRGASFEGSRAIPVTAWWRLSASSTSREPTLPVAPMMAIFMRVSYYAGLACSLSNRGCPFAGHPVRRTRLTHSVRIGLAAGRNVTELPGTLRVTAPVDYRMNAIALVRHS